MCSGSSCGPSADAPPAVVGIAAGRGRGSREHRGRSSKARWDAVVSTKELVAVLWGNEVGRLTCDRNGRLRFTYADAWRERDDAMPLSLSMPLAAHEHAHKPVSAFLWGLLPDNEVVLRRWGQRFQVSARNAFALIANVGEDCAGPCSSCEPSGSTRSWAAGPCRWSGSTTRTSPSACVCCGRTGERGAARRTPDSSASPVRRRRPRSCFDEGRFGVPSGRTPTTHILKPPLREFPGHVENEHFCMALARELGLATALSEVRRFGDELAIVVTRYDRARTADLAAAAAARAASGGGEGRGAEEGGERRAAEAAAASAEASALASSRSRSPSCRLHQEDMCQALASRRPRSTRTRGGPRRADHRTPAREFEQSPGGRRGLRGRARVQLDHRGHGCAREELLAAPRGGRAGAPGAALRPGQRPSVSRASMSNGSAWP